MSNNSTWIRGHKIGNWLLYTCAFKVENIVCDNVWGSIYASEYMNIETEVSFPGQTDSIGYYRAGGSFRGNGNNTWLILVGKGNKPSDSGFPTFQLLRGTISTVGGVISLWMFGEIRN